MTKPKPWHAAFNQPPWSPKNGRNRKPYPQTHSDPADRASADASTRTDWSAITIGSWHPIFSIPDPPPIPYAGIRAGEIIGHRMWWVIRDNDLCSLAHLFIWQPEQVVTGDLDKIVILAPFFGQHVFGGVYSYASSNELAKELIGYNDNDLAFPSVVSFSDHQPPIAVRGIAIGTIKCWGEVIEHERGYRAQYAKIQSIDRVIGRVDINALKERYKV